MLQLATVQPGFLGVESTCDAESFGISSFMKWMARTCCCRPAQRNVSASLRRISNCARTTILVNRHSIGIRKGEAERPDAPIHFLAMRRSAATTPIPFYHARLLRLMKQAMPTRRIHIITAFIPMASFAAPGQSRRHEQIEDALHVLNVRKTHIHGHYADTAQPPARNTQMHVASPHRLAQKTGAYRTIAVTATAAGVVVTGELPVLSSGLPELFVPRNGSVEHIEAARRDGGSVFINDPQREPETIDFNEFHDDAMKEKPVVLIRRMPPFESIAIGPRDGMFPGVLSNHIAGHVDAQIVLAPGIIEGGGLRWRCVTRNIAPSDRPVPCSAADCSNPHRSPCLFHLRLPSPRDC
ncbi:MAG: hypothetical protein LBL59_02325 [Xanthomonadaceae bacterium]|nr:hypothetical protein [Xanthomonadaceae bacterium]